MKKYLIHGLMGFVFMSCLGISASAQIITGGYKPAAVDNERVVAAAEFAVENRVENNTEQEGLTLDSIDKAEMQSVGGTNFRICMTVSIDEESQQVQAIVYQNLQKVYTLKSWTPVETCGEDKSDDEMAIFKKNLFKTK